MTFNSGLQQVLFAAVLQLFVIAFACPATQAFEVANLPPVDSIQALAKTAVHDPSRSWANTLLDVTEYSYSDSLHATRSVHRAMQIFDKRVGGALEDSRLTFSRVSERLTRISARTILPSGETIPVGESEFRVDDLPSVMSLNASIVQWLFPRLESGVIVEYKVEFDVTLDFAYDLSHRLAADDADPIRHRVIEVSCPVQWPIRHRASGRLSFSESVVGGMRSYRWYADSLPGSQYTYILGGMPPRIPDWVTIYHDRVWSDVADRFWGVYEPYLRPDSIIRQVANIWAPVPIAREAQVSTIFDSVATAVRYEMTPLRGSPDEPRPPKNVLGTRYGDCKDKATLLVALLRSRDIDAYPALVTSRDMSWFDMQWPDAEQFEHMIVYLPDIGGRFMDPTCDVCSWEELPKPYQGKPALILGLDAIDTIVFTPASPEVPGSEHTFVRVDASSIPARVDIQVRVVGDRALQRRRSADASDSESTRLLVEARTYRGLWKGSRLEDYELKIGEGTPRSVEYMARYENDSLFAMTREIELIPLLSTLVFPPVEKIGEGGLISGFASAFGDERRVEMLIVPGPDWELADSRISWAIDTTWFSTQSRVQTWDDSSLVSTTFRANQFQESAQEIKLLSSSLEMLKRRAWRQSGGYRRLPDPNRIEKLKNAMAEHPNDASFPLALAQLYFGDDDGGAGCSGVERRVKARALLDHARHITPGDEGPLLDLGYSLLSDQRPVDADSVVKEHLSQHPQSDNINYLRASIATARGEDREAADILQKINDGTPFLHFMRADALALAGDAEGAKSELAVVEMLDDDPESVRRSRIGVLLMLKEFDAIDSLLTDLPSTIGGYRDSIKIAIAMRMEDYESTATLLSKMMERDPDIAQLNNDYAWSLARSGRRLDLALTCAEKARALESCSYRIQNTYGYVLLKLGRVDEARREFQAALEAQDAESVTLNNYCLGECDRVQGNLPGAAKYYRLAQEGKGSEEFSRLAAEALLDIE